MVELGKDVAHIICGAGGREDFDDKAWDLIARPIFDSVEIFVCDNIEDVCDNIEGQLWDQIQLNDN